MMMSIKNLPNFFAGLLFTVFGGGFALLSQNYRFGTASQMGPGFFPMILGCLLAFLGVIVTIRSVSLDQRQAMEPMFLRPLLLVLGPVTLFGVVLQSLGLVLAGALLIIGSALASTEFSLRYVIPTAIILLTGSYLVFIYGLGLPMPIWPG